MEFLQARIAATQAIIVAYETALTALSGSQTHSWTLDTGQTRQTVTKKDIADMQNSLDKAYNLLAVLEARLNGAAIQGRPGW